MRMNPGQKEVQIQRPEETSLNQIIPTEHLSTRFVIQHFYSNSLFLAVRQI